MYPLSASLLRVLGGYAADHIGGEKTTLLSFVVVVLGALLMILSGGSIGTAIEGTLLLALSMGFANAAVFKLVPKYSPAAVSGAAVIVAGLGAFGGFVIPPLMGFFVKLRGIYGYSLGFMVFLALALLAIGLIFVLRRQVSANG